MPLLKYSVLRLIVLAACILVLLPFVKGWLVIALAIVLAALISYVFLGRFRDQSAEYLAQAAARRKAGINSPGTDDADEDREADAITGWGTTTPPTGMTPESDSQSEPQQHPES